MLHKKLVLFSLALTGIVLATEGDSSVTEVDAHQDSLSVHRDHQESISPNASLGGTLTVRGKRHVVQSVAQREKTLVGEDLLATRGESLGEALSRLPGVSVLRTGTVAKPVVHGMHSQRLLVIQDGVRLEGQSWGAEHAPETDPFAVDRMTVIEGGASVRYGSGAVGGVVLLEPPSLPTKPGNEIQTLSAFASNGLGMSSAVQARGRSERWPSLAWRLHGSVRHQGDQWSPVSNLPNTALEEKGWSAALGWTSSVVAMQVSHAQFLQNQGLLSSAHIGNLTDLKTLLAYGEPSDTVPWRWSVRRPRQAVVHDITRLRLQNAMSQNWNWEISTGWQTDVRQEWDLHKPIDATLAAKDAPQLDYTLRTFNGEALASREWSDFGKFQWGTAFLRQENVYAGRAFVPNYRSTSLGSFAFWGQQLGQWSADVGLRLDQVHLDVWRRVASKVVARSHNWQNLSGSLGLQWKPTAGVQLRSGVASGWRAPLAVELWADGLHHGAASVERGDSTLDAERSLTAQTSASVHLGTWEFEAGIWGTYVQDWIGLVPDAQPVLTVRGAFPSYHYRSTHAVLTGADLKLGWQPWEWNEWEIKGNWIRARDYRDQPLPFSPVSSLELGSFLLGEVWGGLRDWKIGPKVQWRDGGEVIPNDYAPPPEGVVLWGAQASVGGEWPGCWDLVLSGDNITNVRWKDPADRLRYFASRPGTTWNARLAVRF